MDPNEALRQFREAYRQYDLAKDGEVALVHAIEGMESAAGLFEWLAQGGFAPDWSRES